MQKSIIEIDATERNPFNIYLSQESNRALTLIRFIHADITAISQTLKFSGQGLNSDIFAVSTSLISSVTPQRWLNVFDGSSDPVAYL